jgi:glycosyltransferase involved in cell wall biosynthesis
MPLVSVIIPTRNRSTLLREAIESALAVRRDGFALEVIVVDDGSTDDTRAVATAYPVVYLRAEGMGASAARNAGMDAAHGEFIAFLDDDDVWLPNNIAPQLRVLAEHPEYGAVYAQVQLTDADRVPYGEPIPVGPALSGWIFDDLLTYWPQVGAVVVRAAVVREVGGFDTSLISEEEWDWILRLARHYPIGRVAEPVLLFRQRGLSDDATSWRRFPDTVRVFHRHTRHMALAKRLRLQRLLWAHRGWYAAGFVHSARHYVRQGDRARALRTFSYALRASPMHAIVTLTSSWRREIADASTSFQR